MDRVPEDTLSITPYTIDCFEYTHYVMNIFSKASRDIDMFLIEKMRKTRSKTPRVQRSFGKEDLFRIVAYVIPTNIYIKSFDSVSTPLRIATNPSIAIQGEEVHIYLRLSSLGAHPVPNPWSRTFIGYARIRLSDLHGELRLQAVPLLYPFITYERVEDPRIYIDRLELYHVRAFEFDRPLPQGFKSFTMTFLARLSTPSHVEVIEPLRFLWVDGSEYMFKDFRDTFPLNEHYMVVRPWVEDVGLGMIGIAPRKDVLIEIKDVIFHPELAPTDNERKTGGNCIAKISTNEYLLIFHGVDRLLGCYYTYAALLDNNGELLGVTPKPILSPRIRSYFGARPATIFVCGAQIVKDRLILSAGKDDEIALILETELKKVIENMKFLKG